MTLRWALVKLTWRTAGVVGMLGVYIHVVPRFY